MGSPSSSNVLLVQPLPTCVQPLGREEAYASLASKIFAAAVATNAPAKKLMNFTNRKQKTIYSKESNFSQLQRHSAEAAFKTHVAMITNTLHRLSQSDENVFLPDEHRFLSIHAATIDLRCF